MPEPRQLDLLDQLREAPSNGTETSNIAAEMIQPSAGTLRRQVLDYITLCGETGAIDEEIQDALAMNPSTERPRRGELVDAGLVYCNDTRRKTKSGRPACVWFAR